MFIIKPTVLFITILNLGMFSTNLITFYCLLSISLHSDKNMSSKPDLLHTLKWFVRLLNADRGLIDFGWMLRPSLSHEKQPYPWPNSLLSARATVTQLSAGNLMNQRRKGDIAHTHACMHSREETQRRRARQAGTEQQKPCQARWFTDEE